MLGEPADRNRNLAPWLDQKAATWLAASDPWMRLLGMVKKTLDNDARRFPHQIRAAAAFVILFCREGYWPAQDGTRVRDEIVGLAKRQLSVVRQMYAFESRSKPELLANPDFKAILKALDEELRMLDARLAEEPLTMPDAPPMSWGPFFPDNARPSQ